MDTSIEEHQPEPAPEGKDDTTGTLLDVIEKRSSDARTSIEKERHLGNEEMTEASASISKNNNKNNLKCALTSTEQQELYREKEKQKVYLEKQEPKKEMTKSGAPCDTSLSMTETDNFDETIMVGVGQTMDKSAKSDISNSARHQEQLMNYLLDQEMTKAATGASMSTSEREQKAALVGGTEQKEPRSPEGQEEDASVTNLVRAAPRPRNNLAPGAYAASPGNFATRNSSLDYDGAYATDDEGEGNPRSSQNPPIAGSSAAAGNVDNSQLAQARPVQEDDLEIAQTAQPVDFTADDKNSQPKPMLLQRWVAPLGCLVLLSVLIFLLILLSPHKSETSLVPTMAPIPDVPATTSPTPFSPDVFVLSLLPEYTVEAVQQKPDSAQALAFDWIMSDSGLLNYTSERIIQRFALATLYFSTNGPSAWAFDSGWLSESHECSWLMSAAAFQAYFYEIYSPCLIDGTNVTGHGEVYKYLHLESNGFQGTVPEEMYLLTNLEHINLGLNVGLGGTISTRLGQLTNLEFLSFASSGMSGTIPTEMALLHSTLSSVFLYNVGLEGAIPSELGLLTSLMEIDLSEQSLTGPIPVEFANLHQSLQVLFLTQLTLTGTIPSELGKLTVLRELGLQGNSLTGSVATELGQLGDLHYMSISHNQLSSTIPSEAGQLSALIQLDLTSNSLSGQIPTELGHLTAEPTNPNIDWYHFDPPRPAGKFLWLLLAENSLTGTLPSQIGLLTDLEMVDVHQNSLMSTIPPEFALLTSLHTLNLTENKLSGHVDEALCIVESLDFDCSSELCGCNCTCA